MVEREKNKQETTEENRPLAEDELEEVVGGDTTSRTLQRRYKTGPHAPTAASPPILRTRHPRLSGDRIAADDIEWLSIAAQHVGT